MLGNENYSKETYEPLATRQQLHKWSAVKAKTKRDETLRAYFAESLLEEVI